MSNTNWDPNTGFNADVVTTDMGLKEFQSQRTIKTETVKPPLMPDGVYNGMLVQIYKQTYEGKNNTTFTKYQYEILVGDKVLKGNTYTQYLDADMKTLNIPNIKSLLGQEVRALVITETLVDEMTKAEIRFNKVKRMWLTAAE